MCTKLNLGRSATQPPGSFIDPYQQRSEPTGVLDGPLAIAGGQHVLRRRKWLEG
jgi:hypothetical protein